MRAMTPSTLVIAGVATLLASSVSFGAITNSVGSNTVWSFEAYTNGQDIGTIPTDSWQAPADSIVVVSSNYPTPAADYPIPTNEADHNLILDLRADATNLISSTGNVLVWLDHLVQPRQWDQDGDPDSIPTDAQMAYYFNTNGNMVIYHRGVTNFTDKSNMWSVIEEPVIAEDSWVRVSVGMDYGSGALDGSFKYFQVKINGTLASATDAIVAPGATYTGNGTYFAMAYDSVAQPAGINQVLLNGTGKFDDFVVTTNTPDIIVKHTVVAAIPSGATGGTITPSGQVLVTDGSNQTFVVEAYQYWTIQKVDIDGVTVTNTPASPYTNTMMAVSADATIDAYFEADNTNGVPHWWLVDAGLTVGADPDADPDGDGLTTAQEHLASTDPDDAMSTFRITRTWQANGTNYVQWGGELIDPTLSDFVVESADSPTNTFTPAGATVSRGDTNIWTEAATTETFYRLKAEE